MSDHEYDTLVEALRQADPDHPFLQSVEPEKFNGKMEVRHPEPMLSIEKAYTSLQLERFIDRVRKEADEIGLKKVLLRVTPKLDGLAGRDDGAVFATRGNGEIGYEISGVFQKGVVPVGGRGLGIGEIVIVKSYFEEHLSDKFEHPRNMVVGIVASENLNEFAQKALQDKVVHFLPYAMAASWEGEADEFFENLEKIKEDLTSKTDYPMDGIVASLVDESLKRYMGATAHHYRWQIAVKTKGETALTIVEAIQWQVGRSGNITPVLKVRPVSISGATIRRVTAHHAGKILEDRIGMGSEIEIIRSGEVIPKIEKVVKESGKPAVPSHCPSCGAPLEWNSYFLKCGNRKCPEQTIQGIYHWFKTLDSADWFGIKTIQKLFQSGFDSLEKIYEMAAKNFMDIGFGPVQSKNLSEAIQTSKHKPVEDWRFLAAFGISDLGKGDSRKLLAHIRIEDVIHIDIDTLIKIQGFGKITSKAIVRDIAQKGETIRHMLSLGFNLVRTPINGSEADSDSPIVKKGVVFTGKMTHGTREEMEAAARRLGAKVQTSVSRNTDFLVCGENVGEAKREKAISLGVRIISEDEYFDMIKGMNSAPLP